MACLIGEAGSLHPAFLGDLILPVTPFRGAFKQTWSNFLGPAFGYLEFLLGIHLCFEHARQTSF